MSRWFRLYDDLVDDPKVQRLSAEAFRSELFAALRGEPSAFDSFIKVGRDRPSGPMWQALRAFVFRRDDFTCAYCGERAGRLECDHVVPVARGGSNDLTNLVTACRPCNRSKRDKLVEDWLP